jgi:hypothetical protein
VCVFFAAETGWSSCYQAAVVFFNHHVTILQRKVNTNSLNRKWYVICSR